MLCLCLVWTMLRSWLFKKMSQPTSYPHSKILSTHWINKWESRQTEDLLEVWMTSMVYNLWVGHRTMMMKLSKQELWMRQLGSSKRASVWLEVCKSGRVLEPSLWTLSRKLLICSLWNSCASLNALCCNCRRLWQHRPPCLKPIHCSLSCMVKKLANQYSISFGYLIAKIVFWTGDKHVGETIANVVTSLPFIVLGLQTPRQVHPWTTKLLL